MAQNAKEQVDEADTGVATAVDTPGGDAPENPAGVPAAREAWGERHWRLAHLPTVLGASLALLVLAAVVGGLFAGGVGALGAASGVGVVTVSYLLSTLVIAWADSVDPRLVLPSGLGMYIAKFTVLGVVMAGVAGSGWAGLRPFGVGVMVGVVVWTGANIWWVTRIHQARLRRTTGG